MHKEETEKAYADNDIIGVRHKHVTEIIGLASTGDVCPMLKEVIPTLLVSTAGIICEVKGGETRTSSLNESKILQLYKKVGNN